MSKIISIDDLIDQCESISKDYKELKSGNAEIQIHLFEGGRMDRYFEQWIESRRFSVPVLFIDGKLFMSIAPLEIESHINPIKWSRGHVFIAGLGMGYIVNQIKDKPSVKSVTVVERNQEVIDIYKKTFGEHSKVTIICEDIFEHVSDKKFDYGYYDIWPHMDFEETIKDCLSLKDLVECKTASFWGTERWIEAILHRFDGIDEFQGMYPFPFTREMLDNCAELSGVFRRSIELDYDRRLGNEDRERVQSVSI